MRRLLFSLLCSALLAGPISAQAPVSSQDTLAYTTSSVRLREKPFPNGARAGGAASRHRRPALRLLPSWCSVAVSRLAGYLLQEFLGAQASQAATSEGGGYIHSHGERVPS